MALIARVPWGRIKPSYGGGVDLSHPLAQGLVRCWLFNEGGGGSAYDIVTGAALINTGATIVSGAFAGSAYSFNGTSNYLEVDATPITAVPLSIVAWFNPTSTLTGIIAAINARTTALGNGFELVLRPANVLRASAVSSGTAGATDTSGTGSGAYTLNGWNQGVAVFASTTSRTVYLNGGNSTSSAVSITPSGLDTIIVGTRATNNTHNNFYTGSVDHVLIYNRALSAAEVQQLYARPFCFMQSRKLWLPESAAAPPAASGYAYIGRYF